VGTATCSGLKLNGEDVRLAVTEVNVICNAVTGMGFTSANGSGLAANPFFIWNGSNWAIGSSPTPPMQSVSCVA
jgi:hypothetical protein